ncbi:hypothetical protein T440DRAFT_511104 [Plenodomus tracheiphilus IPT5]|uniref:BTB domain-containing protein n=1 Tax=Plenodomus tracheiphilus IPT5 TaxID=1408161 RepID=A0A6A7AS05_9PLEO|nr:hypothetical protein T440DRAFT_511104 [Plenodomus tracheiphilus IPT5]
MDSEGLLKEKSSRACANFWNDPAFAVAAHHAFLTIPYSDKYLRDIILKTLAYHANEMLKKPEIEALFTESNGMAYALLKAKTSKYSDFTITCGGEIYSVHKAVVCARSGFFERAERFPQEDGSLKGNVDLSEDEPAIVKLLVQYLYEGLHGFPALGTHSAPVFTGSRLSRYYYEFPHTCSSRYPPPEHKVCDHHSCRSDPYDDECNDFVCKVCCPYWSLPPAETMLLHAKMYEIGDKYDVTGLKDLSKHNFHLSCISHWNDDTFASSAHYAFSTTPDEDKGLRDIVSQTIADHMVLLNKPAVEAILNEFNGLAVGILKTRAKDLGWIK